jgi:GT2 family glycosyltransferase
MNDVSVILTVWKRNHLEEQVLALLEQTIKPYKILVYHCCDHVDIKPVIDKYTFLEYIHSSVDLGYFGRFSIARHIDTTYTYVVDDDVVPGIGWIEKCIVACEQYKSIVCSAGRILGNSLSDKPVRGQSTLIGDHGSYPINYALKESFVDFGCNSWFFRSEWLQHFWAISPYTLKNGEDIHLSATSKILGNIPTFVPQQIDPNGTGNRKRNYGYDEFASWTKGEFFEVRAKIINYLKEKGWTMLH